jgi:hypothetical protein
VSTRPIGPVVDPLHEARPPERQTMAGVRVRLEPIDPELHAESLYALSHGPGMAWLWDYLPHGPFADLADFTGWLEGCAATADPLSFAVIDLQSGRVLDHPWMVQKDGAGLPRKDLDRLIIGTEPRRETGTASGRRRGTTHAAGADANQPRPPA